MKSALWVNRVAPSMEKGSFEISFGRPTPPQKIRIFGWPDATDSLAVQVNRVMHHQATTCMCSICRVEDESTFHALVAFPKARAFRLVLRDIWNLPGEELFKFSGPDWLRILLDQLNSTRWEHILLVFWRAWHLRNNLIFGKGKESTTGSAIFVESYWSSFTSCQANAAMVSTNKCKETVAGCRPIHTSFRNNEVWRPPSSNHIKII